MISNCNIMGKPVIITRLVDTMGSNPRPTRCAFLRQHPPWQRQKIGPSGSGSDLELR